MTRTRSPSRQTIIRNPSCLISCSQSGPAGGDGARVGRQGLGGSMGGHVAEWNEWRQAVLAMAVGAGNQERSAYARFERDRATQLLALARKARDDGKVVADELTRLATEASDHADELDRREAQHQQSAHQRVFPGAALGSAQRTSSRGQAARSAGACTYRAPIR